jgi:hypothetical protein
VVEVARRTPLEPSHDRLEGSPVEANGAPAGSERKPVEVDPRSGRHR